MRSFSPGRRWISEQQQNLESRREGKPNSSVTVDAVEFSVSIPGHHI
jgi:hypothetical protein